MTTALNKAATALSQFALFCIGCAFAGMGLFVLMVLALFGLAAAGLAILASPFLRTAAETPARPGAA